MNGDDHFFGFWRTISMLGKFGPEVFSLLFKSEICYPDYFESSEFNSGVYLFSF